MPNGQNQVNEGKTEFHQRSANNGKKLSTGRQVKLLCFWSYFEIFRHLDKVSLKNFAPMGSKVNKR